MNTPRNNMGVSLIVLAFMMALGSSPARAVTPEEAFAAGCGGCHTSEKKILRRIPSGTDAVRRAWILKFMANHPNERDSLKSEIVEHLINKSAASKSWWQLR